VQAAARLDKFSSALSSESKSTVTTGANNKKKKKKGDKQATHVLLETGLPERVDGQLVEELLHGFLRGGQLSPKAARELVERSRLVCFHRSPPSALRPPPSASLLVSLSLSLALKARVRMHEETG
jgi:hypothetical protein